MEVWSNAGSHDAAGLSATQAPANASCKGAKQDPPFRKPETGADQPWCRSVYAHESKIGSEETNQRG